MRGALVDGRYRLIDPIGEGTFGSVWRAEDARLAGRPVAMKFLKEEFLTHPEAVARFESEADALAQVQHPNVVGVFDRGTWEGQRFLATEFVRGTTLRAWLEAHRVRGALPARSEVLVVFDRMCAGVAAAHAVRSPGPIVHRDLKPENVMVDAHDAADPQVKILDFGIAQLGGRKGTQTGALLGTLSYMAPEQGVGDVRAVAPTTDVFALGVILVEMLTLRSQPDDTGAWWGVVLRRAGAVRALLGAMRADVPPALWDVAARALSADGGGRQADAGALRGEVRSALADRPSLPAALAATLPAEARTHLTAPLASVPQPPGAPARDDVAATVLSAPPAPRTASTTMPIARSVAATPTTTRGAAVGAAAGALLVAGIATAFVAGRRSAPADSVTAPAAAAVDPGRATGVRRGAPLADGRGDRSRARDRPCGRRMRRPDGGRRHLPPAPDGHDLQGGGAPTPRRARGARVERRGFVAQRRDVAHLPGARPRGLGGGERGVRIPAPRRVRRAQRVSAVAGPPVRPRRAGDSGQNAIFFSGPRRVCPRRDQSPTGPVWFRFATGGVEA